MTKHNASLYVIAAPSGAGKTSLVHALLDSMTNLVVSISHTTRAPRPGEEDGVNYNFISEEQFKKMQANDEFLESALVFDNYYGTSKDTVLKTLQSGKDVILEIDWQGAKQIKQLMPDTVTIFVLPPSLKALHSRLTKRAQDSEEVIAARMAKAKNEIAQNINFDYIVVNDNFDSAVADLRAIIRANRLLKVNQLNLRKKLLDELISKN